MNDSTEYITFRSGEVARVMQRRDVKSVYLECVQWARRECAVPIGARYVLTENEVAANRV